MTKKEVLVRVWYVLSYLYLGYMTISFLLGKADTFTTVGLFLVYAILAINLISSIMLKVIQYVNYKILVNGFAYLQAIHKERYKRYFSGCKEEIEECSMDIAKLGNDILNVGEHAISNNLLSKNHIAEVKEILNQTKEMMTE